MIDIPNATITHMLFQKHMAIYDKHIDESQKDHDLITRMASILKMQ